MKKTPTLDISFTLLLWLTLLLPVFFVPVPFVPFQLSKTLLVLVLTGAILVLVSLKVLRSGELHLPPLWALGAVWILPAAHLVTALFSKVPTLSFVGYEFSSGTFGFMLVGAAFTTAALFVLRGRSHVFSVLIMLLIGAWIVLLFQCVQVLFNGPFPLAFLADPAANLVGGWNDLGLFAGLVALLVLLSLESLTLSRARQVLLALTLAVSLALLTVVNMAEAWALFAFASFATFVFALVKHFFMSGGSPRAGILSAAMLFVSLFFLVFGGSVAPLLQRAASLSVVEARPSFQATTAVLESVYREYPVSGMGPGTFGHAWYLNRPSEIVQTPFWSVRFNKGYSAFMTAATEGGIVLLVAWLLFSLGVLYASVRVLLLVDLKDQHSFITIAASLGALYLLVAHYLYPPSESLTLLLFLFVALVFASYSSLAESPGTVLRLKENPRAGFVFVLSGMLCLIILLGGVYKAGAAYLSSFYHSRAVALAGSGDLSGGRASLETALAIAPQDRYFRTGALINLAELSRVVGSGASDAGAQSAFQKALSEAVDYTGRGLALDSSSFENWMIRGFVYGNAASLGIEGGYESAVGVYEEARKRNPRDPEVDIRLAELHRLQGDSTLASEAVLLALSKKPDYTPAIIFKAQLELDANNLSEAIASLEGALFLEPTNPTLLYQLGILLLQDGSYTRAAESFESAIAQVPSFANAAFFLAQSYAFLDRFEEASALMDRLVAENPDNIDVRSYAVRLADGENPFDTAPVALDTDEVEIE